MGYILPVTNHQYINYQTRDINQKKNKHHIEGPFKVILDEAYENKSNKYFHQPNRYTYNNWVQTVADQFNRGSYVDTNI
ncbi:hypothetical protein ACLIBG_02685 [Virgibacillus sp. W0181]|uniref:hypothetical protein n=1 Tax=Virgibacillus sp. W0181 TaxID=3391581 RepID=UPI003F464222